MRLIRTYIRGARHDNRHMQRKRRQIYRVGMKGRGTVQQEHRRLHRNRSGSERSRRTRGWGAGTGQEECMQDTHHQHTYMYHAYALLVRHPHTAYPLVPRVNGLAASVSLRSTPVQPPVPFADHFVLSFSLCPPSSSLRVRCFASLGSFVRSFVRSCYSCREHPDAAFRRLQCATAPLFLSLYLTLFHSLALFLYTSVSFHPSVPAPTASGHPRAPLFSAARPFLVPNPARFHG